MWIFQLLLAEEKVRRQMLQSQQEIRRMVPDVSEGPAASLGHHGGLFCSAMIPRPPPTS